MRLRKRRVVEPDLDEQRWRRRESPVFEAGLVCLRGLPHLVVAELLFGLQQRTYHGSKTRPADLALGMRRGTPRWGHLAGGSARTRGVPKTCSTCCGH